MSDQTSMRRKPVSEQPLDRERLQRVIAVINGKGGVGKTTLTANIGGILALSGWRVLLVDLDSQGNLGEDLGYYGTDVDDEGLALSMSLQFGVPIEPVRAVRENLDVLIGGQHLEATSTVLATRGSKAGARDGRFAVADVISSLGHDYDIVLLDCPPNNDTIQSAAVAAARYILIPTRQDIASLRGLSKVARRFDSVTDINPDLSLLGVVIVDSDTQGTQIRKSMGNEIVAALGGEGARPYLFDSYLRHSAGTAKSARDKGVLVHELEDQIRRGPKWWESLRLGEAATGPKSATDVAGDLQAIAIEVRDRLTAAEAEASNV